MYAVIFKAKVGEQDEQYTEMVARMRELAFEKYHCVDFIAVTEGDMEVAISYWNSEKDIERWHRDVEHAKAQMFGKQKWYQEYQVEVVEIKRKYGSNY
ncbi:antibiotic biosynthesis monooxygenase [Shewanella maritima]|uniref:Antibiotic biosynthesis monooxygenase n=1 Tax=Shewanella maritima TaxID=2520507 RepID=A0A411PE08_9GAMM|nr:antibiotic biosynthesis monooxygenase [Shewanella maritima]QBF81728.1 antibiotic biosynthesis monooxygenase [Shewanella maritima]